MTPARSIFALRFVDPYEGMGNGDELAVEFRFLASRFGALEAGVEALPGYDFWDGEVGLWFSFVLRMPGYWDYTRNAELDTAGYARMRIRFSPTICTQDAYTWRPLAERDWVDVLPALRALARLLN